MGCGDCNCGGNEKCGGTKKKKKKRNNSTQNRKIRFGRRWMEALKKKHTHTHAADYRFSFFFQMAVRNFECFGINLKTYTHTYTRTCTKEIFIK